MICSRSGAGYRLRGVLLAGVLCLVTGAAAPGVAGRQADAAGIELPERSVTAPDFTLPELAEHPVSLDEYRGKVLVVHFWATFCSSCMHELPVLEFLWQRYRDEGLVVLGISLVRGSDSVVRKFAAHAGASFPVLLDRAGEVRNRYEVMALPTSYVVGRDGRRSGRAIGTLDWDGPAAREYIESLL